MRKHFGATIKENSPLRWESSLCHKNRGGIEQSDNIALRDFPFYKKDKTDLDEFLKPDNILKKKGAVSFTCKFFENLKEREIL